MAVFTFIFLRTVLTSWTHGADASRKNLLIARHKVSFVFWLPYRYVDDVRQLPGVEAATPGVWFGGKDPKHDGEFFATIGLDPNTYFDVDTETIITEQEKQALRDNRRGAIVGDALASKFGWKVGDRVTLESGRFAAPPDRPWTFDIVAIYESGAKTVDRSTFYLRYDYLNDSLPPEQRDRIGWMVVRIKPGETTAEVTRRIDARFENTDAPTLSQDERAFRTQFLAGISAVLQGLNIISLIIIVIMMLILGNTIAMGVRERSSEYGALRAIGFLPRHIVLFIVGEATMTGFLGGLLGVAIAFPIIQLGLSPEVEKNLGGVFPYFRVETSVLIGAFALAGMLGMLAAAVPSVGAARLRIVDSLRRVA